MYPSYLPHILLTHIQLRSAKQQMSKHCSVNTTWLSSTIKLFYLVDSLFLTQKFKINHMPTEIKINSGFKWVNNIYTTNGVKNNL